MWIYIWSSEIKDLKIWTTTPSAVYLWENKVRPTTPYPTDNILSHFPFIDDTQDKVWNATLSITWEKQDIWYRFNWYSTSQWTIDNIWAGVFVSAWVKYLRIGSSWQSIWIPYWWLWQNLWSNLGSKKNKYSIYINNSEVLVWSFSATTGQWYHLAQWWNWEKLIWYVNWVQTIDYPVTSWIATWTSGKLLTQLDYVLSDVFYTSVAWTESEILNYYSSTKANYWL